MGRERKEAESQAAVGRKDGACKKEGVLDVVASGY